MGWPNLDSAIFAFRQACCRHGTFLLDADQQVPAYVDEVFFRFRFYYQDRGAEEVRRLYHVEWANNGCDSGASGPNPHACTHIEFDVPQSSANNAPVQLEGGGGNARASSCRATHLVRACSCCVRVRAVML